MEATKPSGLGMTHGVAYDPEVWKKHPAEPFALFTWDKDAEAFAQMLREVERIDVVVVEL